VPDDSPRLGRGATLVLAIACGVAVSSIYFPQAVVPLIARDLGVPPESAALVATVAQLGYALGLFLLVPLGDRVPHRPLLLTLLGLTATGLVVAGLAPNLPVLLVLGAAVGVTTVVPQVLLPMAAGLVPDDRRGAVTGTLLSGLLAGILLARTFGGVLGEWLGWRGPYLVAAGLVVLVAGALARAVPATTPTSRQRYPALLGTALRLLATEPDLRRSGTYQALMFGAFSAAWTSVVLLLTGPTYGLDARAVGLLALVGAGSVLVSPVAGRRADRSGPGAVNLVCFVGALLSAGVLALAAGGGWPGLVALAAGMLLLDVAVQAGGVANQARIFALRPEVRSRLNTAYTTCGFLGGAAGSWLGIQAQVRLGWVGVCGLVGLAAGIALLRHLLGQCPNGPPPKKSGPNRTRATRQRQPPQLPERRPTRGCAAQ
jgi:predicted MFS family arabinose efflux permease